MLAEQIPHTTTITIAPDKPHENGVISIRGSDVRSSKQTQSRSNHHSSNSNNNTTPDASYTPSITPTTQTNDDSHHGGKHRSSTRRRSCISFQDNLTDNYLERGRRLNGIQFPLHPLQLSGWVAIIGFGVSTYSVLIPALHPTLQAPLIYVVSCLYTVHFATHLAALLIDPSDDELRKQCSKRVVPEFDRTKHSHVIENGRCHLCNIKIKSSRTKHCSVCNKCVAHFDHHCKWLNQCVGGRNYVAFLMCVVSAVITAMVILATVITELILYYLKSEWLTLWAVDTMNATHLHSSDTLIHKSDPIPSTIFNDSLIEFIGNETTMQPDIMFNATESLFDTIDEQMIIPIGISIHDAIFLTFITTLGILAAITVGLLLHLCFFHVYISFLGLTTYEYIRNQRQKDALKEANKNKQIQDAAKSLEKLPDDGLQIYFCSHIDPKNLIQSNETPTSNGSKALFCCDSSMQYNSTTHKAFYFCTVLHDRSTKIAVVSDDDDTMIDDANRVSRSKTFHCCSEYKQIVKLADAGDESATNIDESIRSETNTSMAEYVKFTEQCTFCSFKLKTKATRAAFVDATPHNSDSHTYETSLDGRKSKRKSSKSISASVDDSELSSHNHISTISESIDRKSNVERQSHRECNNANGVQAKSQISRVAVNGYSEKPSTVQSIESLNHQRAALTRDMKRTNRDDTSRRMWPEGINSLLRRLSRYKLQPHYTDNLNAVHMNGNGSNGRGASPRKSAKQNQIHPVDSSDQEYEDVHYRQPHDVRRNLAQHLQQQQHQKQHQQQHQQQHHKRKAENNIAADDENETSIEENDLVQTRNLERPAPPPPVRRKISTASDMQQLAETLSFIQNPQHLHHHYPSKVQKMPRDQCATQAMQRTIPVNNRRRRKNILRTRSPNLSPIHESGYSNPTSPQPFRNHSMQQHA